MNKPLYIVSIDLGTTNCAVSYTSIEELKNKEKPDIHIFRVPQLIEKSEVADMELFPSFLYIPGNYEITPESYRLPWSEEEHFITGEYAKQLGRFIPGRLVSSAKSWLCHRGVDRTAKILPWSGPKDMEKISPLETSSKYLDHIKKAWNFKIAHENPEKKLEYQDIIITVPASFNEVARTLTVKAASMAGLEHITLLEEPQAAFYSWLTAYEHSLKKYLGKSQLILVCDVGGGTTDFTLIKVEKSGEVINLKRIAVGEHILLGGDNMDLALAKFMEKKIKNAYGNLDTRQWGILCQESQKAKELLLGEEHIGDITITIPGTGSRLIGGMLQVNITKNEVLQIIMEGFFPLTDIRVSEKKGRYGIQEWGLPYESDPAITHHMAYFLRAQATDGQPACPDVVIFNGGALKPDIIRNRIVEVLNTWSGTSVKILQNSNMDLAVARGGVYYGLVRKGRGLRIKGGTPRSYYIGIDTQKEKDKSLSICIMPRDLEEGEEVTISEREFLLLLGQPVSFPLYSSTVRLSDRPGEILEINEDNFASLPPLYTILKTDKDHGEIPVHLKAKVSEVGTLELYCISPDCSDKWKLEFNLRIKEEEKAYIDRPFKTETIKKVKKLISDTFLKKPGKITAEDIRPKNLFPHIEKLLGKNRNDWDMGVIREFWEPLYEIKEKRRSTPEYEASWLNSAGFCLRPGFGYPLDDWRLKELWSLFPKWLQYNKEKHVRMEWWILWRRVAAGLAGEWQEEIFNKISPYLFSERTHIKPFSGPSPAPAERMEILRMAVSLEELSQEHKLKLGELIMGRFKKEGNQRNTFWLLARLAARVPFSASVHNTIPGDIVSRWIQQIVETKWEEKDSLAFCMSSIARYTGDRVRDIYPELRERLIRKMKKEKCLEDYIKPVETMLEIRQEEKTMLFGESLPIGLKLSDQ